jgi:hypothetical protein
LHTIEVLAELAFFSIQEKNRSGGVVAGSGAARGDGPPSWFQVRYKLIGIHKVSLITTSVTQPATLVQNASSV